MQSSPKPKAGSTHGSQAIAHRTRTSLTWFRQDRRRTEPKKSGRASNLTPVPTSAPGNWVALSSDMMSDSVQKCCYPPPFSVWLAYDTLPRDQDVGPKSLRPRRSKSWSGSSSSNSCHSENRLGCVGFLKARPRGRPSAEHFLKPQVQVTKTVPEMLRKSNGSP